jgi:L-fuculose-phosphate aldolase
MNTSRSCLTQQRPEVTPHSSVVSQLLCYADLCCRRGYVSNSLGNICLRVEDKQFPDEAVCYTKHRGVSLEEMQSSHVVITNIKDGQLLYGATEPSIGHQLNRKIFSERKDISAVIHLHANSVIAYFSATKNTKLPFISVDTPLILEKPVFVLDPGENVEVIPDSIPDFIHDTNCFVMPHHGITSVGQTLSQAYHRLNSVVAEIDRLIASMAICTKDQSELIYRSDVDVNNMFAEGRKIVYGEYEPTYDGFSQ